MKTTALAALLAISALGAPAMASTIVLNGSFEDDAGTKGKKNGTEFNKIAASSRGWDTFATLPGWVALDKKDVIGVHADKGSKDIDAMFGELYVELDSKVSPAIRQTLALSVGSYLLSFYVSPSSLGNDDEDDEDEDKKDKKDKKSSGISYSIGDLTGTLLGTNGNGEASVGKWTEVTGRFNIAKDGNYDLDFAAFNSNGIFRGYLDNVSVEAARIEPIAPPAPATVPVPAAGLLLVGAIAALGSLARRRRGA
jgi:hypothetical protein